jgi:N-acyl homoserine lactone hydrolase
VRVEMFNAGWMTTPVGLWRQDEEEPGHQVRFPISVYVIETERERILVDTGLHPKAAADPAGYYGADSSMQAFALELDATLDEQFDLAEISRVVMTHLHFDHAGGLDQIPEDVPIVLQRREWEAGRDQAAIEKNFFRPIDYAGVEDRVELVDGDHDLLGDGSVRLLLTPGHTPGHQSVRVGEELVIGGDVGHYGSTLDDLRFPVFADDFEAQAESARRLREMRDGGMTVTPGHDPELLRPGRVT